MQLTKDEIAAMHEAVKQLPSISSIKTLRDKVLAAHSAGEQESPFDAMKHQTLLGYDRNGDAVFGADPKALAAHEANNARAHAYPTIDHRLTEIAGEREIGHVIQEMTHMEVARQAWAAARAMTGSAGAHAESMTDAAGVESLRGSCPDGKSCEIGCYGECEKQCAPQPAAVAKEGMTHKRILEIAAPYFILSESCYGKEFNPHPQYHGSDLSVIAFARALLAKGE